MGYFTGTRAQAIAAGLTPRILSVELLQEIGFTRAWIAEDAYLDAGGVLRWPDAITGVAATPTQGTQYQPTRIVENGMPIVSMASTDGNVCGFQANQGLGLGDAYTLYVVMDVGTTIGGGFILRSTDPDNAFAAWYSNNTTANLNVRHTSATQARSDDNTLGKGARAISLAGWSKARGSVVFARDAQAFQAPDVLAANPVNAASPLLLAENTGLSGFRGAKVAMMGIVPVDHTLPVNAADRRATIALLRAAYGI